MALRTERRGGGGGGDQVPREQESSAVQDGQECVQTQRSGEEEDVGSLV